MTAGMEMVIRPPRRECLVLDALRSGPLRLAWLTLGAWGVSIIGNNLGQLARCARKSGRVLGKAVKIRCGGATVTRLAAR